MKLPRKKLNVNELSKGNRPHIFPTVTHHWEPKKVRNSYRTTAEIYSVPINKIDMIDMVRVQGLT